MSSANRIAGLDLLRGVAMILGIALHGAIAYKAGYHYGEWVKDNHTYWFYDWLYLFINSFRMQLFFVLAGFFARTLLYRYGTSYFISNRLKRIALPLAIAYFTILPLTLLPFLYSLYGEGPQAWQQVIDFIKSFFLLKSYYGLIHLWFLQHLLVFYALATMGWYLAIKKPALFASFRLPDWITQKWIFIVMMCIVIFGITQLYDTPLPSIWTGFKIPMPQFIYYFFFFIVGWFLHSKPELFSAIRSNYLLLIVSGLILSVFTVFALNEYVDSRSLFLLGGLRAAMSVQTVVLAIGFIGWFVNQFKEPLPVYRYIADSAYWIYLIHLPIVLTLQIAFKYSTIPGVLRFPLVVIITVALSVISYHFLVRNTWVGVLLNGKRKSKPA